MKIGIISDIHGNIKAFEAVLKELNKQNIDKIICLGDLMNGAVMAEEVIQKLIQLGDKIIVVRGNQEGYIIDGLPKTFHDEKLEVKEIHIKKNKWIKNSISKSSLEYISKLPKEMIYEVEEKKIYISHYPLDENGKYRKHIKKANIEDNEKMFSGIDADIYLYGHTHEEIYNTKNDKYYINPGALGCPGKTNNAPYGILNIKNGDVEYKQLYVEYNVEKVIEEIKKAKYPEYEYNLKLFYGVEENEDSNSKS